MKTKLITGRYKGYEVCYANKGQIFPRDGWYLTKGDDVIYIENALAQTREETIIWTLNNIKAFEDEWKEYKGNKTKGEYLIQRYGELNKLKK